MCVVRSSPRSSSSRTAAWAPVEECETETGQFAVPTFTVLRDEVTGQCIGGVEGPGDMGEGEGGPRVPQQVEEQEVEFEPLGVGVEAAAPNLGNGPVVCY